TPFPQRILNCRQRAQWSGGHPLWRMATGSYGFRECENINAIRTFCPHSPVSPQKLGERPLPGTSTGGNGSILAFREWRSSAKNELSRKFPLHPRSSSGKIDFLNFSALFMLEPPEAGTCWI